MRKLKWNMFVFFGMMFVLILATHEALPAATPAKTVTLKVACHMAPGTQMSAVMEWWCKEIEKRTNGTVKTTYYPLDSLGKFQDYTDMLQGGVSDVSTLPGFKFTTLQAFELPFVGPGHALSIDSAYTLYYRGLLADLKDYKVLWLQSSGPSYFYFRNKKPNSRDEFKGLKIRGLPGVWVEIPKSLGATGVAIPSLEVYQALERGVVDGAVAALGFYTEGKLNEVAKIYADKRINGGILPVAMSINRWKSLPPDVQLVVEQLNAEARYQFSRGPWFRSQEQDHTFMKSLGCERYQISSQEEARWHKDVEPLVQDWIAKTEAKGLRGQEIIDVIRSVGKLYE